MVDFAALVFHRFEIALFFDCHGATKLSQYTALIPADRVNHIRHYSVIEEISFLNRI